MLTVKQIFFLKCNYVLKFGLLKFSLNYKIQVALNKKS